MKKTPLSIAAISGIGINSLAGAGMFDAGMRGEGLGFDQDWAAPVVQLAQPQKDWVEKDVGGEGGKAPPQAARDFFGHSKPAPVFLVEALGEYLGQVSSQVATLPQRR